MLALVGTMYWIISEYGLVLDREPKAELIEVKVVSGFESLDEEESRYEELKCGICLRSYSSNWEELMPRMLRCGHTVCYGCAIQLGRNTIYCPFCRRCTPETSRNLPKNYTLIGLLEEIKRLESKKK
uniref:RING-type domain-containing protein n=1 Tax=Caenorhabditis tropicalis TaxID=1561998 RepID=A0A1I7U7Q9_9PELO